ncbi:MAG: Gfo/Idh/MocA family oxidoreductase [Clostridiaceae bacterium]|nr:Gfo/Idh/MocA family oxidoreductase [Clostridiaceae bacterium]
MFRIGILGSENSHATAFSRIFNGLDPKSETKYPDMRVVGCFGHYPEENEKLKENCGLDFIADKPEDMLGKVDAVMVTARNGQFHPEFARPFIEAGIPAFIDKPFANCGCEAVKLAKLAKEKNVPLVGGSSTKLCYDVRMMAFFRKNGLEAVYGGSCAAPLNMDNPYGGFYFYSSHLAEISMTIFGYNPKSIRAFRNGNNVTAIAHYDGFDVSNHFIDGNYSYTASIYGKGKTYSRDLDISMCYQHECEIFVDMLRTGKMSHSYEHLVAPVIYLNAIKKSYENGGEEVTLEFSEI